MRRPSEIPTRQLWSVVGNDTVEDPIITEYTFKCYKGIFLPLHWVKLNPTKVRCIYLSASILPKRLDIGEEGVSINIRSQSPVLKLICRKALSLASCGVGEITNSPLRCSRSCFLSQGNTYPPSSRQSHRINSPLTTMPQVGYRSCIHTNHTSHSLMQVSWFFRTDGI